MPVGLSGLVRIAALALATAGLSDPTSASPRVEAASWGYQLVYSGTTEQIVSRLAAMPHDLLVIDYSADGSVGRRFTRRQIARIASGPYGRRLVASYISIGEASEFRGEPIWRRDWTSDGRARGRLTGSAPSWMGEVNPNWPESRKVRYWQKDWQRRIFNDAGTGWLDRIVAQGFDAAYLDIVLAYYYWSEKDGLPVQQTARSMMRFIIDMTRHARRANPDFFVIPQNGAWIVNDAGLAGATRGQPEHALRTAFLDAIGAIAVEDVYYRGQRRENNRFAPDTGSIGVLKRDFLCHGKPVLSVDYISDTPKVRRYFQESARDGFLGCAAPDRNLTRSCLPAATSPSRPVCG